MTKRPGAGGPSSTRISVPPGNDRLVTAAARRNRTSLPSSSNGGKGARKPAISSAVPVVWDIRGLALGVRKSATTTTDEAKPEKKRGGRRRRTGNTQQRSTLDTAGLGKGDWHHQLGARPNCQFKQLCALFRAQGRACPRRRRGTNREADRRAASPNRASSRSAHCRSSSTTARQRAKRRSKSPLWQERRIS